MCRMITGLYLRFYGDTDAPRVFRPKFGSLGVLVKREKFAA
jgi:hypothetical protein